MSNLLAYFRIIGLFSLWYYKDAILSILGIWRNFILFVSNYFSIILLFRTLFVPWKKISESYGRGFDFGRFVRVLTLNFLSRTLGFIVRSVVIAMGILAEFFVLIFGAIFFILWLFLPAILVWVFWRGIVLII